MNMRESAFFRQWIPRDVGHLDFFALIHLHSVIEERFLAISLSVSGEGKPVLREGPSIGTTEAGGVEIGPFREKSGTLKSLHFYILTQL